MCGIIGALAYGEFETKAEERIRQESMIYLTTELLQQTQSRGKDATGISTLFSDGDYMGLKMGIAAQEFVTRFGGEKTDFEGYLNIWRKKNKPAKIVIGHCRKPSTGTRAGADDNKNNHPIKVGNIIGVHNGTLTNHEEVFKNLGCGRDGKVDSEAIFRLLNHLTNEGTEPFSAEVIQETCKRLSGSYAVLTFNGNNPFQLASFLDARPLEICIVRPLKLVLLASDRDFLKVAMVRYNKMAALYQFAKPKFEILKKSDVDTCKLTDDSLYLFDIRQDITSETKISEVYTTEKVARSGKIWTGKKTTYTGARTTTNHSVVGASRPQGPSATNKSAGSAATTTTQTATSKGTTKADEKSLERVGMAWDKDSKVFVAVAKVKRAEKHGDVEADCESGKITNIDSETKVKDVIHIGEKKGAGVSVDSLDFTESEKPVDDMVTDPAKIKEVEVSKKKYIDNEEESEISKESDIVVKDMDAHPDVLEKAIEATQKQHSFSNNAELANALEINDYDAMKKMPCYSLANRIKSFFFKAGFFAGYLACKKEMARSPKGMESSYEVETQRRADMMQRATEKIRKSSTTIRNIKTMTKILSIICGDSDDAEINTVIDGAIESGEELNLETLQKTFKSGDRRNFPVIDRIMTRITEKQTINQEE